MTRIGGVKWIVSQGKIAIAIMLKCKNKDGIDYRTTDQQVKTQKIMKIRARKEVRDHPQLSLLRNKLKIADLDTIL